MAHRSTPTVSIRATTYGPWRDRTHAGRLEPHALAWGDTELLRRLNRVEPVSGTPADERIVANSDQACE